VLYPSEPLRTQSFTRTARRMFPLSFRRGASIRVSLQVSIASETDAN